MAYTALISALLFSQAQFAPSDVPKDHWAFPAVNALFEEGLLRGYPAAGKPLGLAAGVPMDLKEARSRLDRWVAEKLLVGYPSRHVPSSNREASRYELAVAVHALCSQLKAGITDVPWPVIEKELPHVAHIVSMFQKELVELGQNPVALVAELEQIRQKQVVPLELDRKATFDRDQLLMTLNRWEGKKLFGQLRHQLNQVRGFVFANANDYEVTLLVYDAWDAVCKNGGWHREEHRDLVMAISKARTNLVRIGGDPESMVAKLNRIREQRALRFKG